MLKATATGIQFIQFQTLFRSLLKRLIYQRRGYAAVSGGGGRVLSTMTTKNMYALADPGGPWRPGTSLPPRYSHSQKFSDKRREKLLFLANFGFRPPLGSKLCWPPDQNPAFASDTVVSWHNSIVCFSAFLIYYFWSFPETDSHLKHCVF